MRLQIREYPVTSLEWADMNGYAEGSLTLHKEALIRFLEEDGGLAELMLTDLELICPQTSARVINIAEVLPAHARLGEGASDYPGLAGPLQTAGEGISVQLSDFSVLAIASLPSRYVKVLDKEGPGNALSPYSGHFHLAFRAVPRKQDMRRSDYFAQLKKMGLILGAYVARVAAGSGAAPHRAADYDLTPCADKLPRAVYVCMLASLQNWDKGEPILYGNDLANMLPCVLHPNEMLDGAITAQNFNLGIDTYSFVNNPVVKELYARHGKDLDFAGVVVYASHATREQRERSVQMTCTLVKHVLHADMAILTKVGGGIPESDVMMAVENLEKQGVTTTAILWSQWGDGTIKDILSAFSPAADAMVSVGINDTAICLPPQKRVVGGLTLDPLSDDPEALPQPADQEIVLRTREYCGAINQLGASKVAMIER
ncbi:MAG: glycine/sarcosine/betaine reductase component B subunit [Clostridiales bacterium]|nr:glycine/sarcosine/betaine reductase component B subunit [Clostridiales bacterium]